MIFPPRQPLWMVRRRVASAAETTIGCIGEFVYRVARSLEVVLFQLTNYQARVAAHFISDRLTVRPTIALTPQPAQ